MSPPRTRPRWAVVLALLLPLVPGCAEDTGVSQEEFASILSWLHCDDCRSNERERVDSIGMRAAPLLAEAILAYPSDRRENMRTQYGRLYTSMPSASVDSATFVNQSLAAFDAKVRTRAAVSMADIGAFDELQAVLDSATALGWTAEARAPLESNLIRDFASLAEGSGPATTWSIDDPTVGVEVCNGVGPTSCSGTHGVTLHATATGPTGTFAMPWTHVFFLAVDPSSALPPEVVGTTTAVTMTDDGVAERDYSWSYVFSAPGHAPGPIRLYAVGVTASGERYRTPPFTLVTITNGA